MSLSEREEFGAMVKFLELYYERTKTDDVGSLLGDMIFDSDGTTFDPATWEEWLQCVNVIKNNNT